ncbi:hypothetical protein [Streptomyces sp. DB-54]
MTTLTWGFFMFGDAISLVSGFGIAVCVGGVDLVQPQRSRKAGAAHLAPIPVDAPRPIPAHQPTASRGEHP